MSTFCGEHQDITPSYSALPVTALLEVKSKAEEFGLKTKVVFLMRDPLDRYISAKRMMIRNRVRRRGRPINDSEIEGLFSDYTSEGVQLRARYQDTVKNLEQVFGPEDIYYGLYETLFSTESINSLLDFLGLKEAGLPDFSTRVNSSEEVSYDVSNSLKSEIVNHYSETYEFCVEHFPELDVERVWPGFKYLVR